MTNLTVARNQWFEAKRHNLRTEEEAVRHNTEQERLTQEQNELNRRALEETARANRAKEAAQLEQLRIDQAKTAEVVRNNIVTALEQQRSHQANEKITRAANRMANSREWEKLSQNEQRMQVQNALDGAATDLKGLEAQVKEQEVKQNLPAATARKIDAEIEYQWRNLQNAEKKLAQDKRLKESELTLQQQKQASERLVNASKTISGVLSALEKLSQMLPAEVDHLK